MAEDPQVLEKRLEKQQRKHEQVESAHALARARRDETSRAADAADRAAATAAGAPRGAQGQDRAGRQAAEGGRAARPETGGATVPGGQGARRLDAELTKRRKKLAKAEAGLAAAQALNTASLARSTGTASARTSPAKRTPAKRTTATKRSASATTAKKTAVKRTPTKRTPAKTAGTTRRSTRRPFRLISAPRRAPAASRSCAAGYDGVGVFRVGVGRLREALVLADLVGIALLDVLVVLLLVVPVQAFQRCVRHEVGVPA